MITQEAGGCKEPAHLRFTLTPVRVGRSMPDMAKGRMVVTRREFMAGAGATLAATGALTGFPAIAQRRPFKVGVFISEVDAQGVDERVEPYVSQMRVGLGLTASEINTMGGVLGRPVELVYRDDGGTPPPGLPQED